MKREKLSLVKFFESVRDKDYSVGFEEIEKKIYHFVFNISMIIIR